MTCCHEGNKVGYDQVVDTASSLNCQTLPLSLKADYGCTVEHILNKTVIQKTTNLRINLVNCFNSAIAVGSEVN